MRKDRIKRLMKATHLSPSDLSPLGIAYIRNTLEVANSKALEKLDINEIEAYRMREIVKDYDIKDMKSLYDDADIETIDDATLKESIRKELGLSNG
jgi:hypothetical protein